MCGQPFLPYASYVKSLLQRQQDADLTKKASLNFLTACKNFKTGKKFLQLHAQQQLSCSNYTTNTTK